MKLTMLGTGHAGVTECYNTCFLLEEQGQYLLTDGGGGNGLLKQLKDAGKDWRDIHDIFVTHHHIDHLLGIVWMMRRILSLMKNGQYEGEARIYAHEEVTGILNSIAHMVLTEKETDFIGNRFKLITVEDGGRAEIIGCPVTFFDIHSVKAKQFGFTMEFSGGRKFTCCGDEPCREQEYGYAAGSDWLLQEAFCLYEDREKYHPYEKQHSTVKDACETAEKLGVKNLILYHTEDSDLKNRKTRYIEEGQKYFSGKLYVPDDLEYIEL